MVSITGIVLTFNEQANIKACIEHHARYFDEFIIIDGYSTDRTFEIVSNIKKDKDFQHVSFVLNGTTNDFATLRNKAMVVSKNDWIVFIDADELFSEDFLKVTKLYINDDTPAYSFVRVNTPYSYNFPDYQTRFVNRLKTMYTNPIHEICVLSDGSEFEPKQLPQFPITHNQTTVRIQLLKLLRYLTIEEPPDYERVIAYLQSEGVKLDQISVSR